MDHGIFGSQGLMRKLLVKTFQMSDETADKFMACFAQFKQESILNEYYTDLITCLDEDIQVSHTRTHFIYANQMRKHFYGRSDDIPASDTSITYDTYSQTSDVAADIWSQQDKTIKLVVIMIWETPAISVS